MSRVWESLWDWDKETGRLEMTRVWHWVMGWDLGLVCLFYSRHKMGLDSVGVKSSRTRSTHINPIKYMGQSWVKLEFNKSKLDPKNIIGPILESNSALRVLLNGSGRVSMGWVISQSNPFKALASSKKY